MEETPDQLLPDQSHQTDEKQVDEDVIDFALSEPTATVEVPPIRHSIRVQQSLDKLTLQVVFKPGAPVAGQRALGFLELFLCGRLYVCVSAPKATNN